MLQEDISKKNDNFEQYKERISNFSGEFELGLFLFIARKSLIWIALFFALAISISYIYLRYTPPIFESTSIIQVQSSNQANKVLNVSTLETDNGLAESVELLRSQVFLKRVLATLPLEISYFSEGTFKNNELYLNNPYSVQVKILSASIIGTKIHVDFNDKLEGNINYSLNGKNYSKVVTGQTWTKFPEFELHITIIDIAKIIEQQSLVKSNAFYFTINDTSLLTAAYFPRLDVKLLNESAKTILISFKDLNPTKAADIVSSMTDEFKAFDIEHKRQSSKKVIEFINQQLEFVYNKLKKSEETIEDFKKSNHINNEIDLSSINKTRLNGLEDQILAYELEENVLAKIDKTISNSKSIDTYTLLAILAGSGTESSLTSTVQALHKLLIQKEEMLYVATPSSDAITAIDYQINIQKKLLKESIVSLRSNINLKVNELKKKTSTFEGGISTVPTNEIEYGRLQRLLGIDEKYYTLLLEKKTEYSISDAGFVSDNLILEKANASSIPVSPNRKVTYIIYILAASLLSLLLVLFRYLSHNEINSLNEITKYTHAAISILGIVPKCRQDIPVSQLLIDKSPKSLIAESFRSIRSNLQFLSNEPGSKIIALTSTISGEGKTFVAINLAGIIALSGKKVLLIDLDMRKPKIHIGFNVSNTKGMSTLLIERDQLNDTIQHSALESLHFITAGPIPPNPAELIISKKMDDLLVELKTKYDVIIIDNPPVGLVSDGISIIQKADYPIYIFRADYSKRNFIHNVDRLFNENNIKKLSVILNGVDIERKNYGYNYGYGYGYGYGTGYGYYDEGAKSSVKKGFFKS